MVNSGGPNLCKLAIQEGLPAMPKRSGSKPNRYTGRLPYSGQIIGAVMRAFDIEIESPDPRTVRRYLSGQPVSENSETEFFLSLGEVLVKRGIVPVPDVFKECDVSMPVIAGCAIARAAVKWDRLIAEIRSRGGRDLDVRVVVTGFLRLVVIDLAVRVFALLRLCKTPLATLESPSWARENGGGLMLRELLADSPLTRKDLAEKMGVSDTSIDNWFDGKVKPTLHNQHELGEHLAEAFPNRTRESLIQKIQLRFALTEICDLLSAQIGRETVLELATALHRFVELMEEDAKRMARPPIEEVFRAEFDFFRLGVDASEAPTLLRNISLDVDSPEWNSYLWAATIDWQVAFETIAAQAARGSGSAGLAMDIYDSPSLSVEQAEIETNAFQDMSKTFRPDIGTLSGTFYSIESLFRFLELNILWRRQVVERYPLSSNAHQNLGSFLGMVAKHFGNAEYLEEGIAECKIAAAILPGWDVPLVEPAIMLGNIGLYERALAELDSAEALLPELTPHFNYCSGYVLMNLGRFQEALERFESVLAVSPDYALALEDAARCAFALDDKVKARRYAKLAKRAGGPDLLPLFREVRSAKRRRQSV